MKSIKQRTWILGRAALCFTAVCIGSLFAFGQAGPRGAGSETVQRAWLNDSATQRVTSIHIDSGSVSRNEYGFYWETRIEPPTPAWSGGFDTKTLTEPGAIHRVFFDRSARAYFGYDVTIDVLPPGMGYRVTFRPLTMTEQLGRQALSESPNNWKMVSSPHFPAPLTIQPGDILELNLMTNASTGQTVIDYVTVQEPAKKFSGFDRIPDRQFSFATGVARDFRTEDVEMRIQLPRVSTNGKVEPSTAGHLGDAKGAVVWFYLPRRGRFILSLVPHPELGFRKAGEIRGTTLSFTDGSDRFELSSGVPIAPGQAVFNLYVLHQPSWLPTYSFADLSAFIMGAEDRAESLIEKKE
jgi:hypothetical protein